MEKGKIQVFGLYIHERGSNITVRQQALRAELTTQTALLVSSKYPHRRRLLDAIDIYASYIKLRSDAPCSCEIS